MAIIRRVITQVHCDICGKWITGWDSTGRGVGLISAAIYAREKGASTGKLVKCKECRIKERIEKCSLMKKHGKATIEATGKCLGFQDVESDEPIEQCKRCIANNTYDWEEHKRRIEESRWRR